jgi:hypothetical protein
MSVRRTGRGRWPTARRLLLPAVAAVAAGLVVAVLGLTGAAGGKPEPDAAGAAGGATAMTGQPSPPGSGPVAVASGPGTAGTPAPELAYPLAGPRTWRTAAGRGPVLGTAGRLKRFRVSVENGITGLTPAAFAEAVVTTLSDPRSWTAKGRWRLQRVGPGDAAEFTIYLATPATRAKLCYDDSDRYTSCRYENRVVVNVARWAHGVPNYGASLADYRLYVINHEVGHELGHGHELCPGPGKPAPVMQQQTLGLHGCTANSWPLLDGRLYAGRSGQYDDPVPSTG